MSRYEYTVNENNVLSMWDTENPNADGSPFLIQPHWPNGLAWRSKEEAESWAEAMVASLSDPQSEYLPGPSPEKPTVLRPVEESEESPAE